MANSIVVGGKQIKLAGRAPLGDVIKLAPGQRDFVLCEGYTRHAHPCSAHLNVVGHYRIMGGPLLVECYQCGRLYEVKSDGRGFGKVAS